MSNNELGLYSANFNVATPAGKGYLFNCTPVAISGSGTLSIAQMLNRVVVVTSASAVALTTDSSANIITALSAPQPYYNNALPIPANRVVESPPVGTSFQFQIMNQGSSSGAVTLSAGAGVTLVLSTATIPITIGNVRTVTVVISAAGAVTMYC